MLVSRKGPALLPACPHSLLAHPLPLWRRSLVSNIWEYIYPLTYPGLPTLTQWCLRQTLSLIYRKFYKNVNTSILTNYNYTASVHPLLEYSCAVWDLAYLQMDIDKLESVQRLACKICTKDWSTSYSDHQYILSLPTPHDRRVFLKLCNVQDCQLHFFS